MSLCKTCTNDRCVIEEGKIIDKCAEYREKSDTEKIKALFDQVAENAKNETVILRAETFDRLRNDLADVIKERDKLQAELDDLKKNMIICRKCLGYIYGGSVSKKICFCHEVKDETR